MKIEPDILRHMWPRAPQAKIDTICGISEDVFAEHGIEDVAVVVQLMANISHENGAGTIIRESGNYSEPRILEIFGVGKSSAKVTEQEAPALAHHAEALFERVYNLPNSPKLAKELGNHEPGDGYKYRGGGDLQLTGRAAYTEIGDMTGYSEIAVDPDAIADPEMSFRVAVAEFVAKGCVKWSTASPTLDVNTVKVRRIINGGSNGLAEVRVWVRRWATCLPGIEEAPKVPRGADTDNKSVLSSKIMKGVISTGTAVATAAGSKVAENANTTTSTVDVHDVLEKAHQANDAITTIQSTIEGGKVLVTTIKPVLGLPPNLWAAIAIASLVVAIGTLVYTGYQRYAKMRDQGV